MVYAPQRRHATVTLSSTMQTLALMQHLYSPNSMVLICRVAAHINMRAPPIIQPTRSLFALFFLVFVTNIAAVLLHMLDFASGQNGGKGLILDFVGQANPASFTRIMLLDAAIFVIQLTTLVLSYLTNYAATLPKSDYFPYDDLLLPPAARPMVTEADLDVEAGEQFRQRRLGKGPRYQNVPDAEVWFDEDEEDDPLLGAAPPTRVFTDVSRTRQRQSPIPLIFNVSAMHLINLVFRLPNPVPPRLFSGGTPLHSPPSTPTQTQESVRNLVAALAEVQPLASGAAGTPTSIQRPAAANAATATAAATQAEAETAETTRSRSADSDLGDEEQGSPDRQGSRQGSGSRRIPGDYWTSRATG